MSSSKAVALLVAVIAIAYADVLLLGRGFYHSDVISYHYPMKRVVRDVVARGELPLWDRSASSGKPLAANPAYEVWYPPQWLIFLPSFHFGLQLHIVVHFLLAAIGMFVLVRSFGGSLAAALFGALAFVFCGPYLSLTSKLPLLFSLSWMPLALAFVRELLGAFRWPQFAGAAIALGMQMLIGEPVIVIQTWALIAGYVVYGAKKNLRSDAIRVLAVALVAMLVAAAQLIPALDFARDTVRVQPFPFAIVSNWSLPLERPVEMLFPSIFRHTAAPNGDPAITAKYPYRIEPYLAEVYVGILVAILVIAGLLTRRRGALAFVLAFGGAFIVAAGEHTPLLRVLYDLDIGRTLRYPEKFVITAAFAAIVWAALLFDELRTDRRLARAAAAVAAIVALASLIGVVTSKPSPLNTQVYFAIQLARAFVLFAFIGPLRARVPAAVLIALTTLDLAVSMRGAAERRPRAFFEPPPMLAQLPKDGRVFHEAAWDNWENKPLALQWLAGLKPEEFWPLYMNGLFPNIPQQYDRPLALEHDIDRTSLQTHETLREALGRVRASGDIAREEQLLRMSNVRSRIRYKPFEPSARNAVRVEPFDGHPRYAFAESLVNLEIDAALDRRGIVAVADIAPFTPSRGVVTTIRESDNDVALRTNNGGRGLLLIAVSAHKYWRATIDGRDAKLIPANVAYQALDVPAGTHAIELRYRNPLIVPSALVSLLTLLVLATLAFLKRDSGAADRADRDRGPRASARTARARAPR